MKLVILSIILGLLGLYVTSSISHAINNQITGLGILSVGVICFFIPSIYVLEQIYIKINKI